MGLLSKKRFPRFITRGDGSAIDRALAQVDMLDYKQRRIGEPFGRTTAAGLYCAGYRQPTADTFSR